jgi:signal transduction histidine kinase
MGGGMTVRTSDDHPSSTAFSAAAQRERAGRILVFWVMPAVIVLVTFLTFVEWRVGHIPSGLWLATLAFWVLQAAFIVAVRRGVRATLVAGIGLILGGVIEMAAMFDSPDPVGSSSSLLFFVVAASYFLSARATMAFALVCTATITYAAHTVDAWDASFWFPSSAFVTLVTGTLSAFIMSRSRLTERRLEQVAENEREAKERLEQVDRARDRLIANVSHELRTPLTSTIGSVETLLREDVQIDEPSRRRLLLVARDGGLRLLALVEDLLTLGATRPDSLELDAESEQLASLARDAIEGIDPGDDRSVEIVVIDDPPVHVDRLRMLQVVAILVVNAIRHGKGAVVIETQRIGDEAHLRVIDDGDGVDPAHEGELFLPFARFSTRPDSTGLGLAICRTIIEAHGGRIGYHRTPDERTCFWVHLPVRPDR